MPQELITSDPAVMFGRPVVAGTRVTFELILERLADGYTTEDLLAAYPRLTPESVMAASAFGATFVRRLWHARRRRHVALDT